MLRLVVADIDVQIAIRIDIDQSGTAAPSLAATDSGFARDISKFPLAKIAIEPVLARTRDEVEIAAAIAIDITRSHTTAAECARVETLQRMIGVDRIDEIDP